MQVFALYTVTQRFPAEKIDTNYARYENAYVEGRVERKSDVISLSFNGKALLLNFKEGVRDE